MTRAPSHSGLRTQHSGLLLAFLLPSAFLLLPSRAADAPPAPLYAQNFDKLPPGNPPEDLLIINGTFKVAKDADNAFLEMAPDPLESNGVLAGPGGR